MRGGRYPFDLWGETNPGWDWNSVLPYITRYQAILQPIVSNRSTSANSSYKLFQESFIDAAAAAGIPENPNYNNDYGQEFGSNYAQFSMKYLSGSEVKLDRVTAYDAFIGNMRSKIPNLMILADTYVTKIEIRSGSAAGVWTDPPRINPSGLILATKEVIVSAGTFQTPQLLMLSGIGPSADLQKLGIPVVKDLPGVGQSLQDDLGSSLVFTTSIYMELPPFGLMPSQLFAPLNLSNIEPTDPLNIQFQMYAGFPNGATFP